MRTFSLVFAFALVAACGSETAPADEQGASQAEETDPLLQAEADARQQLAESGRIYCAVGGAAGFSPNCTIEQTQREEGLVLTVRHPDGGFRRLLVTNDGRGVVAADGAEAAEVLPVDNDQIEVAIASDRYRLPATVR